jgi:hypothetical protein
MRERLAHDIARAAEVVDARRPVARNKRTDEPLEPGLGLGQAPVMCPF